MGVGPDWFLGIDVFFDIFFFIIMLLISIFAFRSYKFFKEKKHLQFGIGFGLWSLSYLLFAIVNFFIYANEAPGVNFFFEKLFDLNIAISWLLETRELVLLTGLVILIFLYFDITDYLLQALILFLALFSPIWASHPTVVNPRTSLFFLLTGVLQFAISLKLCVHYWKHKQRSTLLLCVGFIGVFLGTLLFSITLINPIIYVLAYVVKLIGFVFILASLVVLW